MKKTVCLLLTVLFLSACSKESTVEQQLTDILAAVNEKERKGLSYVDRLNRHEKQEQILFAQTMELTQQRYDEVKKQVASLKRSAREREVLIRQEEETLTNAREVAEEFTELLSSADTAHEEMLRKIEDAMQVRYEKHGRLMAVYKELIDAQTHLYTLLEDKSIRTSRLKSVVADVNRLALEVQMEVEEFNEATTIVNHLQTRLLARLEESN